MIARLAALGLAAMCWVAASAEAEDIRTFNGHGGPVKAIALLSNGGAILTASFDNSVGVWPMEEDGPARWLEAHDAAVNAVIPLSGGRAASGGDDFNVVLWDVENGVPLRHLMGHTGKVMGLSATADGTQLASASWDGTVRIWDTATGTELAVLNDHEGPVNAVIWAADGARLYSAGYDGTVLEWATDDWAVSRRLATHGFGINVMALNETAGWLAYGALDGGTRAVDLVTGRQLSDLTAGRRPILSMAQSPDGTRLAVGDGEGYIMVVETPEWRILRDFRAARHGPVWALAFTAAGTAVIAGGIADEAFLWPLDALENAPRMATLQRDFHTPPEDVANGERQFLRKCSICHTLGVDGARRAGPPLAGLFGRKAGAVTGYPYSDAIRALDLVWTEATIDALFDVGPDHYIPGTKMPMQRISAASDRADLIDFLKRETALGVVP
ncbi:MAG: c-type cytochrome [Pseudomonadota bacterium]